jgi:hypothetical protein
LITVNTGHGVSKPSSIQYDRLVYIYKHSLQSSSSNGSWFNHFYFMSFYYMTCFSLTRSIIIVNHTESCTEECVCVYIYIYIYRVIKLYSRMLKCNIIPTWPFVLQTTAFQKCNPWVWGWISIYVNMNMQNWCYSCTEWHIIYAVQHIFHYVRRTLCQSQSLSCQLSALLIS